MVGERGEVCGEAAAGVEVGGEEEGGEEEEEG